MRDVENVKKNYKREIIDEIKKILYKGWKKGVKKHYRRY